MAEPTNELEYSPVNIETNDAAIEHQESVNNTDGPGDPADFDLEYTPEQGDVLDSYNDFKVQDIRNELGYDISSKQGAEGLRMAQANAQGAGQQALNMFGQIIIGEAIGGTIEGFGYLLDFKSIYGKITGSETEWGNWMSDFGAGLRESAQENMAIHQTDPGSFNMADSGWWFGNGVSVASTLSMMIPTFAATRAVGMLGRGLSKSAGFMRASAKMGKKAKWMAEGVSQAVMSRHIENSLEGKGTFEEAYADYQNRVNPETGEIYTDEGARKMAGEAASNNYRMGWAMLSQDIFQYLAIGKVFNPRTMKMEAAIKKGKNLGKGQKPAIPKWARKTLNGVKVMGSEALEEGYQYYISEKAKGLTDLRAGLITEEEYQKLLGDSFNEEMATSAFWGSFGGGFFQMAGPAASNAFKSKKRREYEKNYATIQKNFLLNRGAAYAEFQKELDAADQAEDPARREQVIGQMMMQMTDEAISLDRFDEHIESLYNMKNMSEEEREAFAAEGVEYNQELFEKYIPQAIELSNKIRKRYMKHANKHDHVPAMAMARNEVSIDVFNTSISQEEAAINKAKESSPNYNKVSETSRNIAESRAEIEALKMANTILESNKSSDAEGTKAKHTAETIAANDKKIEELTNTITENKAKLKDRTKEEKANDEKYGLEVDQANEDAAISRAKIAMSDGYVSTLRKENKLLKTKTYQTELRSKALEARTNIEANPEGDLKAQLFEAKAQLADLDNEKDIPKEKITELKEKLTEKIAKIDAMVASKDAADAKAKADQEIIDDAEIIQEVDPTQITPPKTNISTEVEHNISDEIAEPTVSHSAQVLDKQDLIAENKEAALETFQVTFAYASDVYNAWVINGEKKIGTKSEYTLSDYVDGNNSTAVTEFNDLKNREGDVTEADLTEAMINKLPIKVTFGNDPNNFTYLATYTGRNEVHFNKIKAERASIILALVNGKKAISTVGGSTGGAVQTDSTQKLGYVPENSILELEQFDGDIDNIEIVYSDKQGFLIDPITGDIHPEFTNNRMLLKELSKDGLQMPYKGGIYAIVRTADGKSFPLKLNFKRNTVEQAEALAELLEATYASGKDGLSVNSILGDVADENLKEMMETAFAPEIELLGGQEAEILDIINMFTYVSEGTSGLSSELFSSKGKLHFGGEVLKNGNPVAKNALVDFLTNVKRRQYSVALENRIEGYKKFMIEQRIINTNAETKGPLFKGEAGRQTQIYINKIEGTTGTTPKGETSSTGNIIVNVPGNNDRASAIYDKKMLDAELNYLEKTFGKEMADVYFQGIEALPEKNQKELDKILTDTKAVAEERIKDSQIPVSKQTFTVQDDSDDTIIVEVTTQLDGSRKIVQKLDDGSVAGSEKISKDNTLTNKDYVSKAYGDVKSTEDVDIKTVMNPKLESRMSDRQSAALASTQQTSETINIYAGTNENAELSNFANRSFVSEINSGVTFNTVEGAFQAAKLMAAPSYFNKEGLLTKEGEKLIADLSKATGAQAKSIGRKIKGLDVQRWDNLSEGIMKGLIKESFKQNPQALKKLLATGNATLTHTQDRTKYRELFPKILMEVRQELGGSQLTQQTSEVSQESKAATPGPRTISDSDSIVGGENHMDLNAAVFKALGDYKFGIENVKLAGIPTWVHTLTGIKVPLSDLKKINAIRIGFGMQSILEETLISGKKDVSSQTETSFGDKSSLGIASKEIIKKEEEADTKEYKDIKCKTPGKKGKGGIDIMI